MLPSILLLKVMGLLYGVIPMVLIILFIHYLKIYTTSFIYNEDLLDIRTWFHIDKLITNVINGI
jgi:hypothetical protein